MKDPVCACGATCYTGGPCEGQPLWDVVYSSTDGAEIDRHSACFRHCLAEVMRHHNSTGMTRYDLVKQGAAL